MNSTMTIGSCYIDERPNLPYGFEGAEGPIMELQQIFGATKQQAHIDAKFATDVTSLFSQSNFLEEFMKGFSLSADIESLTFFKDLLQRVKG